MEKANNRGTKDSERPTTGDAECRDTSRRRREARTDNRGEKKAKNEPRTGNPPWTRGSIQPEIAPDPGAG